MSNYGLAGWPSIAIAAGLAAGCASDGTPRSTPKARANDGRTALEGVASAPKPGGDTDASDGAKPQGVTSGTATPDAATSSCPDPKLGVPGAFGFVSLTGTLVNHCIATHDPVCSGAPHSSSDVAIDYGNFPFSRVTAGRYFYAVIAEGYEDAGFFDGAVGNLSDRMPSAVDGDRGSGDTIPDRTIVVGEAPVVQLFPSSPGTHKFSFPPAQFMTIHLAPFDTTPENRYVVAICPTTALSHCDCAFEEFKLTPLLGADAGAPLDAGQDAGAMCRDM